MTKLEQLQHIISQLDISILSLEFLYVKSEYDHTLHIHSYATEDIPVQCIIRLKHMTFHFKLCDDRNLIFGYFVDDIAPTYCMDFDLKNPKLIKQIHEEIDEKIKAYLRYYNPCLNPDGHDEIGINARAIIELLKHMAFKCPYRFHLNRTLDGVHIRQEHQDFHSYVTIVDNQLHVYMNYTCSRSDYSMASSSINLDDPQIIQKLGSAIKVSY